MSQPSPSASPAAPAHHDVAPFAHLTASQKVFTMLGTLLGMLLAALDQTVVATAGPVIQRELRIEPSLYVWITTSYLVASTVLVPIYGKLSDQFGRRKILLTGIGIFLVGSALCGVAQTTVQLILFRAVQGVGSAALFTTAFAVIADIFPPVERGKYQGLFGSVFGLSSVVGPLVGGFITDTWGWHWVFFINLPVGALAVTVILLRMPPLHRPRGRTTLDILGAVMLSAFVVPLLLALSLGKAEGAPGHTGYPWASWQILSLFGAAAVALVLFIWVERRAKEPIVDLHLFNVRVFRLGILAAFFAGATFLAAIVFLPLFMVNVVGMSATRSGLTTTPLTFGIVVGNLFVGQLVSRLGRYKAILVGSLVLGVVAYALMGFTLTTTSTQGELTWKMVLLGLGLGPSIPLFTLALQNAVPPPRIGVATSMAMFSRQMGATVGLAVIGTVFAMSLSSRMSAELSEATKSLPPQLVERFRPQSGGGGAGGEVGEAGPGAAAFDVKAIKERIAHSFAEQRQRIAKGGTDAAIPSGDLEASRRATAAAELKLRQAEVQAYQAVEDVAAAIKRAFTEAIRHIYQVCIVVALIGLLLTAITPEVPLRGRGGPPVSVE